jgi:hypothetical protein
MRWFGSGQAKDLDQGVPEDHGVRAKEAGQTWVKILQGYTGKGALPTTVHDGEIAQTVTWIG